MAFLFKKFKFKFGHLLKQFNYWALLISIFLEGNVQFFIYLLTFELKYLFKLEFIQCFNSYLIILSGFFIIFFVSTLLYMFKYLYSKEAECLLDNVNNLIKGIIYLTLTNGWRNIFLGAAHALF
jgi:hypothetical protein